MRSSPARVSRFTGERAEIDLAQEAAERSGLKPGDPLFVFAPGGGVVLLAREAARKSSLVGSLETLSVAEIFGFISSSIRSGMLVLEGPGARRRIAFRDGQVVHASSTELSERLGPVLWRYGILSHEKLQENEPKVGPGARFGKVLVDAGLLTPASLYLGMQKQVREIVLGAFIEAEGEFAFVDEEENPELNTVRLKERTRDLVLEGMARAEEMSVLRQTFDPTGVPKRLDKEAPSGLEQHAVWQRVDGKLAVRDIVRMSRLGEYAALKALRELVMAKLIAPPATDSVRPPLGRQQTLRAASSTASAMQLCGAALDRIRSAVGPEAWSGVLAYIEGLPPAQRALFEGVAMAEAPDLDKILTNAQKIHQGAMARVVVLEALDGIVMFGLFQARNTLPAGKAADLARDVGRVLKGK